MRNPCRARCLHCVEDKIQGSLDACIEKSESSFVCVEMCYEDWVGWDVCVIINVKDVAEKSVNEPINAKGEGAFQILPIVIGSVVDRVVVHYDWIQ